MITSLVLTTILAFSYAECNPVDNHFRAFPVYTHVRFAELGSMPQAKLLLQQIQRPYPQPQPQPQPNPIPQPQPQPIPNPDPGTVDPFNNRGIESDPELLDSYRAQQQLAQQRQQEARQLYPDPPQYRPQPQYQPQPQPRAQLQPQPDQQSPEPHRGFNIQDIERKPIFVFTTTDDKSYDIVYALGGIGGLNADPATKYIADFLIANDTEKLVVVFSYQNFPFDKLPDLPIARLILPSNLKLSFFSEVNMNKPIVAIFTKQQLNALDSFVQQTHVTLIGQIKLPRPASSPKTKIIQK